MLRSSLRGLVAQSRVATARFNVSVETSTRSFCEAKMPKPAAAEAPLQKWWSLSEKWKQAAPHVSSISAVVASAAAMWAAYESRRGGDAGATQASKERLIQENPGKVRPSPALSLWVSRTGSAFAEQPPRNSHQVFTTIGSGNFSLSEEERRELVVREAPLKELKGIVKCTGIEKSYFVVTGEHGVPFAGEEGRSRRLSADPVVIAVVKTGPKGVGKSTLAEMACSEEKARVGERAVLRPMGIDP